MTVSDGGQQQILEVHQPAPAPKDDIAGLYQLAGSALWPLVVLAIVFAFRRQIASALEHIASRIDKIDLGWLSIELTNARANPLKSEALAALTDGAPWTRFDDSSGAIVQSLSGGEPVEYAIVDLGFGRSWLTSRLYFLANVVATLRGLNAVVFVQSTPQVAPAVGMANGTRYTQAYVNLVDTNRLRWALAAKYPWLELAYLRAAERVLTSSADEMPKGTPAKLNAQTGFEAKEAEEIFNQFKGNLRTPEQDGLAIALDAGERAEWVSVAKLWQILDNFGKVAPVVEVTGTKFVQRILNARGPLVPVIDANGSFLRVIDRRALLDSIAGKVAHEMAETDSEDVSRKSN